jgi:photosystem II stability/assembly factor-like uncharacterized protein
VNRLRSGPVLVAALLLITLSGIGVGLALASGSGTPTAQMSSPVSAVVPSAVEWLNPLPQGQPLLAVDFADATTGCAVGEGGTILRTENGGSSWQAQQSPVVSARLASVDLLDANTGWVVAVSGNTLSGRNTKHFLLHTTDGGATWLEKDVASGLNGGISAVRFPDAQHGVATCGLYSGDAIHISATLTTKLVANLLFSEDGGATWSPRLLGDGHTVLSSVAFADASHGWVAGWDFTTQRDTMFRTTDGGATWTQLSGLPTLRGISSISSTSPDDLWLSVTDGSFHPVALHSSDGGTSWSTLTPPGLKSCDAVSFIDADRGWLAGYATGDPWTPRVRILHTVDGGQTWTAVDLSTSNNGQGLALAHQGTSTAWCVGPDGFMARTQDAVLWQRIGVPAGWQPLPARGLISISFSDASHGYVGGSHGALWETSDGSTWRPLSVPLLNYWDIDFASGDGRLAYVLGFDSKIQRYVVLKTTAGGTSWRRVRTNLHRQIARGIFFLDARQGWVFGSRRDHPYLLQTTNGGQSWKLLAASVPGVRLIDLHQVVFTDVLHGWAAGERSVKVSYGITLVETLLRTADGGHSWREVTDRHGARIAAGYVLFEGRQNGWAAGRGGVWRTTDGGPPGG